MPEILWFNDETPRRIKLRSAAVLVGKAPTKEKRIKAMVTMNLDGGGEDQITGLPEWLESSRNFVMKTGETVTTAHAVKGVNVTMGDANLFKKTPTEAPKTQLDHFCIKRMGSSDDPDTVVTFEMRTPFSTDLWGWCGQQSGEEFDVVFDIPNQATDGEGGSLLTMTTPDDGTEEDAEGEEDDASEDDDEDDEEKALTDPEPANIEKNRRIATGKKFDEMPSAPTAKQVADAKKKLAIM